MAVETSGAVARSGPLERPVVLYQILAPTRWLGGALRAGRLTWLATRIDRVISRTRPFAARFVPDRPGPRRWP